MSHFLPHIHSPTPNPQFLFRSFPKTLTIRACSAIPARDRVIDFGKHKGRMLGTLPSTYLKWVSSTLRARDFEDWAKLADQVLADPVYNDRIEWEFAQKVLNGDVLPSSSSSAVSSLVEISERFGWDNEDKLAWKTINFELLGTSNGGRIPRIKDEDVNLKREEEEEEEEEEVKERRGERRARIRLKRSNKSAIPTATAAAIQRLKQGGINNGDGERTERVMESPFPGREGLLRRVMDAKGKRPTF